MTANQGYQRRVDAYMALLETSGLLQLLVEERLKQKDDERSVTAVITDAGRQRLVDVRPGHVDLVERGMFAALDDWQAEALADALDSVRDRFRSLMPSAAKRRRNRR